MGKSSKKSSGGGKGGKATRGGAAHDGGGAGGKRYEQFHAFRTRLNERILGAGKPEGQGGGSTLVTKRFFALDDQTYRDTSADGGLDKRTKELLGLTASAVLRCDDCIAYHVDQCVAAGCSDRQIWEALDVSLIVGGSIVIPHLRRAVEFLDECRLRNSEKQW